MSPARNLCGCIGKYSGEIAWGQSSRRALRHLFPTAARQPRKGPNSPSQFATPFHSTENRCSKQTAGNWVLGVVLPGRELLKGLLGVLASSGNRGGEVGNGRAGNQGLDGRSNGSSANATGDTNEGGHVGEERRLLSETGDVCCRRQVVYW